MLTVLAPVTCQLSVDEPPAVILAGLAENELITGGADGLSPAGCCTWPGGTVILKHPTDIRIRTTIVKGNERNSARFFIKTS
jgi:hypothetical protein